MLGSTAPCTCRSNIVQHVKNMHNCIDLLDWCTTRGYLCMSALAAFPYKAIFMCKQ